MSGSFLLDTNIIIAFQKGEPSVVSAIAQNSVLLSVIVVGELFYGANNSARQAVNIADVERLINRMPIIPCDADTGRVYGRIRALLRAAGTPIPESDVWIAAITVQHQLTLVTRDAHFNHVAGLHYVKW